MLKNASSLAIVGLDTAENGPSKVRQVTNRIEAIIGSDWGSLGREAPDALARGPRRERGQGARGGERPAPGVQTRRPLALQPAGDGSGGRRDEGECDAAATFVQ